MKTQTRVVVIEGNKVEEFDFEAAARKPIRGNIYLALWDAFKEHGIEIPYPRRDVRILKNGGDPAQLS